MVRRLVEETATSHWSLKTTRMQDNFGSSLNNELTIYCVLYSSGMWLSLASTQSFPASQILTSDTVHSHTHTCESKTSRQPPIIVELPWRAYPWTCELELYPRLCGLFTYVCTDVSKLRQVLWRSVEITQPAAKDAGTGDRVASCGRFRPHRTPLGHLQTPPSQARSSHSSRGSRGGRGGGRVTRNGHAAMPDARC